MASTNTPGDAFDTFARATGQDPAALIPPMFAYERFDIDPEVVHEWIIRECDRADYRDWIPYSVGKISSGICAYYANVNPESTAYMHVLMLTVSVRARTGDVRVSAAIDEWDGPQRVSTTPVRVNPDEIKPSADALDELRKYIVGLST